MDEHALTTPVLVDSDSSLRQAYFLPNSDEVFAANPRHYVIDAQGNFAYISTTVSPGALQDAIEHALSAEK